MYDFSIIKDYNSFLSLSNTILIVLGFSSTLIAFGYNFRKKSNTLLFALLLTAMMIWRLGGLPLPNSWTDRDVYANMFKTLQESGIVFNTEGHDQIFGFLSSIIAQFCSVQGCFYVIAAIYVGLYCIACRRLVGGNVGWLLVGCILCMGFTNYGTNTIRAGLAISFILLGLSYSKSLWRMGILLAIGVGIHYSMIIPVSMIILTRYYQNTRLYVFLWALAIPISFLAGGFFQGLFASLSEDSRTSYLNQGNESYDIGFRIDFILYSLAPVVVGYYYIIKRNFQSELYSNLYNAYILTNAFWVLVIRSNFTDRFAYLSWFMLPFLLLYPVLKQPNIVKSPAAWVGTILLGETLFKFIM